MKPSLNVLSVQHIYIPIGCVAEPIFDPDNSMRTSFPDRFRSCFFIFHSNIVSIENQIRVCADRYFIVPAQPWSLPSLCTSFAQSSFLLVLLYLMLFSISISSSMLSLFFISFRLFNWSRVPSLCSILSLTSL